ncbi:hypothetical protein P7K49_033501 [Saguinus oedipus]|uniref:MHD domain-containing protein n=1 Tax=Saguinus oedipus TaxID=9490 RepID=A0ABQ9TSI4_SAGOE|nr:hypothetical protein P7K49_033501 [Saguinus oedipus]
MPGAVEMCQPYDWIEVDYFGSSVITHQGGPGKQERVKPCGVRGQWPPWEVKRRNSFQENSVWPGLRDPGPAHRVSRDHRVLARGQPSSEPLKADSSWGPAAESALGDSGDSQEGRTGARERTLRGLQTHITWPQCGLGGRTQCPPHVHRALEWGANGNVLRSEIVGSIKMRVFLSGMPELRLGLNDKVLFDNTGREYPRRRSCREDGFTGHAWYSPGQGGKSKSVELEDVKFHQCVRLSRFENDRTISFIPPDGEFELMSYRLNTHVKPLIWIESVIEKHSHSRIEYMIKAKSQFKRRSTANNVEIHIPVPNDADSPKFKTTVGSVKWVPENSEIVWSIKSFPVSALHLSPQCSPSAARP